MASLISQAKPYKVKMIEQRLISRMNWSLLVNTASGNITTIWTTFPPSFFGLRHHLAHPVLRLVQINPPSMTCLLHLFLRKARNGPRTTLWQLNTDRIVCQMTYLHPLHLR